MRVVHTEDVPESRVEEGEAEFRRRKLAAAAGGEALGCSLYELPPGSQSWPYHYHTGNEEALYVLAGEGRLRLDDEWYDLEADVYVALPTGPESAHRVCNAVSYPQVVQRASGGSTAERDDERENSTLLSAL